MFDPTKFIEWLKEQIKCRQENVAEYEAAMDAGVTLGSAEQRGLTWNMAKVGAYTHALTVLKQEIEYQKLMKEDDGD